MYSIFFFSFNFQKATEIRFHSPNLWHHKGIIGIEIGTVEDDTNKHYGRHVCIHYVGYNYQIYDSNCDISCVRARRLVYHRNQVSKQQLFDGYSYDF